MARLTARVVLDSTVLIDLLRGHDEARIWLGSLPAIPFASELTRFEVLRGMRAGEQTRTERLFENIAWHPVDEAVARRAGALGRAIRRSHSGSSAADLCIAATALELEAVLATTNVRDFAMFDDLKPPY